MSVLKLKTMSCVGVCPLVIALSGDIYTLPNIQKPTHVDSSGSRINGVVEDQKAVSPQSDSLIPQVGHETKGLQDLISLSNIYGAFK